MLVWSNIFNIAFVSALAALIVFFLVSTIVVAAKGKRKCNAFDVILRILSTLVFIASAAMLAAAVLMMISGSFCIALVADVPLLVVGETVTELPLPELFVALSSSIGLMLVALLFICSLAALIVDCLVANKKTKKVKKQPVQKTPEQLKREAELEKIRRIGEDAVKRADHAAKYAEPSSKKKAAPKAQQQAQVQAAAQAQAKAQAQTSATQATAVEQPKQPELEEKPASDWRVKTESEGPTEFVGLSKTNDPDFDTFDSFDDVSDTPMEETDDIIVTERDLEPEKSEAIEDDFGAQEQVEDELEQEQYEQDDYSQDEASESEQDEFVEDEVVEDEFEQAEDEQEYSDEYNGEIADTEEGEPEQAEDYIEETDGYADEQADCADTGDVDEQTADEIEQVEDEYTEDEYTVEEQAAQPEPELEQEQEIEPEQELEVEETPQEKPTEDEYEPDRDIYIPRIRTIVRNNGAVEPAEKPKKTTKSARKSQTGKKPAAIKSTAAKTATKPAAKKPAAKNTSTAKKSAPKKSAVATAAPKNTKKATPSIPPEKKLPITRRYVILDRRNAVNMFGEYLKDRNQAQKDKLKSSINTIIIE